MNIDETVGVLLEQGSLYSVVNLGTQGYCAFQEAYLVAEYVPKFKPRFVLFFFFENDINDLYGYLTDREINEFIQRDLNDISYKPRTDPSRLISEKSWSNFFHPKLYISPAISILRFKLKRTFKKDQNKPVVIDKLHDVNDEESLAWNYTKRAILYMNAVAKSHHAKFVIAPIIIRNKHHYDILKKFAAQHHLLFIEDARVYEWGWNSDHFLPQDGHFTAIGAEAMAKVVADFLKNN